MLVLLTLQSWWSPCSLCDRLLQYPIQLLPRTSPSRGHWHAHTSVKVKRQWLILTGNPTLRHKRWIAKDFEVVASNSEVYSKQCSGIGPLREYPHLAVYVADEFVTAINVSTLQRPSASHNFYFSTHILHSGMNGALHAVMKPCVANIGLNRSRVARHAVSHNIQYIFDIPNKLA